jgi:hypothetical protein
LWEACINVRDWKEGKENIGLFQTLVLSRGFAYHEHVPDITPRKKGNNKKKKKKKERK